MYRSCRTSWRPEKTVGATERAGYLTGQDETSEAFIGPHREKAVLVSRRVMTKMLEERYAYADIWLGFHTGTAFVPSNPICRHAITEDLSSTYLLPYPPPVYTTTPASVVGILSGQHSGLPCLVGLSLTLHCISNACQGRSMRLKAGHPIQAVPENPTSPTKLERLPLFKVGGMF